MIMAGVLVALVTAASYDKVFGTIDVNLSELEYLATRLNPFECRRLIAALHYTTYELPRSIAGAERRVDEEIPCLQQLLHWNSVPSEGRGKTHDALVHRLRQIDRNDLADWLGRTTFEQLGKDLDRAIARPFGKLGEQEPEASYPLTVVPTDTSDQDDPWSSVDTVLMAILLGLLATLLTLICVSLIVRVRENFRGPEYKELKEPMGTSGRWRTRRSSESSGGAQTGSETEPS